MENNLYLTLFGAITGAIFGSFFNAIALRTVGERPWWGRERSRCPMCDHILGPMDLVPIFSWVCLKGRCRYCLRPIPYRYPLVEIIFSAWGGLAMARWGLSTAGVAASLGGWLMMLNALTDLESGYVYDHLAGAVGLLGLAVRLFGGTSALIDGLWGSVAGGGAIAFIILLSRGGMGWGDATLMAGAGRSTAGMEDDHTGDLLRLHDRRTCGYRHDGDEKSQEERRCPPGPFSCRWSDGLPHMGTSDNGVLVSDAGLALDVIF